MKNVSLTNLIKQYAKPKNNILFMININNNKLAKI